jgi:hypothetical protein
MTLSCDTVTAWSVADGSDVRQAMDQMNPTNSRAIAVTTTWFSLPFATR